MASQEITTTPIPIFQVDQSGEVHTSHGYPFLVKKTDSDQSGVDAQGWRLMKIGESVSSNKYDKILWIAARQRDVDQGVAVTVEVDA